MSATKAETVGAVAVPITFALAVVAVVALIVWALTFAIAGESDPAGRPWEPSGAENVWTSCTDYGDRLYRQGNKTLAVGGRGCEVTR